MAEPRTPRGARRAPEPTGRPSPQRAGRTDAKKAHLTSRAAILAIVMCAIALSLAYPVREYIAQRREIAALRQQERVNQKLVEELAQREHRLGDESYIKREARRRLHYCMPDEKCFIVLDGSGGNRQAAQPGGPRRGPPWYTTLWRSVEAADSGR
jgi:cell division protein FtsB